MSPLFLPLLLAPQVALVAPESTSEVFPVDGGFLWRVFSDQPAKAYLLRNGQTQGVYYRSGPETGQFRLWGDPQSNTLGPLAPLPCALPVGWRLTPPSSEEPIENFGVVRERIADAPEYSLNGRACSRKDALRVMAEGQLPDDANRLRLTIIGSRSDRERVLRDLDTDPQLKPFLDTFVRQDYEPGDWPLACGFLVASPGPTIYVQQPDGKVLHRQSDYQDGPQGLAAALRKLDPSYQAAKDPDLRKSASPLDLFKDLPPWVWAAIGLGLYWFFNRQPPAAPPAPLQPFGPFQFPPPQLQPQGPR